MSSDEEALVLHPKLPVAVLDLATLAKLGSWDVIKEEKDIKKEDAVILKTVRDQGLVRSLGTGPFLWVRPLYEDYSKAWVDAGFKKPVAAKEQREHYRKMGYGSTEFLVVHQLDHVHAKGWAAAQGYGYVLLLNVSSGPNMSGGSIEGKKKKEAEEYEKKHKIKYAKNNNPVFYANKIHSAKLSHVNQDKPGQPTRESRGIRV